MIASRILRWPLLALCLALTSGVHSQAGPGEKVYEPQVGQEGKDVIWVPTSRRLVETMLEMARVTPADTVIDLGSGDGRTVITAAKRGARALGIEYNPDMVELARRNAAKEGVGDQAQFRQADLFATDLSGATVITMFLLPNINLELRPKLLDLRPGTRIVSNSFTMGEWEADETATVYEDCDTYCTAYLWIVPAKVDGIWHTARGDLMLSQEFQHVTGALKNGSRSVSLIKGRIRADEVSFTVDGTHYAGRVNGATIEGTATSARGSTKWTATRGK